MVQVFTDAETPRIYICKKKIVDLPNGSEGGRGGDVQLVWRRMNEKIKKTSCDVGLLL